MAKTTTTRAPRRSAEQIARDELAMTIWADHPDYREEWRP